MKEQTTTIIDFYDNRLSQQYANVIIDYYNNRLRQK